MRRILLGGLVALSCSLTAISPYVELGGQFLDFRQGAGVLGWAPICTDGTSVLFAQGFVGHDRRYLTAYDLGLGYRKLCSDTMGWGVNAFFDVARSSIHRPYYQGGIGAELFGNCWVARANGYAPEIRRTRELLGFERSFVSGTQIFNVNRVKEERSYGGFDLEVGRARTISCGEVWGYAAYYFYDTKWAKPVQGPRFRGEVRLFNSQVLLGPQLVVGAQWSYDHIHQSEGSLYLTLRVPIGRRSCKKGCVRSICRQLYDPVRRNRSIWTERAELDEVRPDPRQIFFIDAQTSGIGTQTDPRSFVGTIATGQPGDILFLVQNAVADTIDGPVDLAECQQLWGFGDNNRALIDLGQGRILQVDRIGPTNVMDLQYRPVLTNNGGDGVTLMDNNTISGIQIDDVDNGIVGMDVFNTVIDDVFITQFDTRGVDIDTGTNLTVTNSTILHAGAGAGDGIFSNDVGGNLIFNRNVVGGSGTTTNLIGIVNTTVDATIEVNGNTLNTGATFGLSIDGGGTANLTSVVTNNFINDVDTGMSLASLGAGADYTTTVTGNRVAAGGPDGMANAIVLTAGQTGADDIFTALVDSNQITGNPPGSPPLTGAAILFDKVAAAVGTSNVTITNNRSDGAAAVAYDLIYNVGGVQTVCTNFRANSATSLTPAALLLAAPVGTSTLYPATGGGGLDVDIKANNTLPVASTVTVGANVVPGPPCPTP